jgi:acyl-CoA synthetase (NDP forming)
MSPRALERLLRPHSIVLIGGACTDAVAAAGCRIGYAGQTFRIHPTRVSDASTRYYRSVAELPGTPDAAFVAAPAEDVPGIAAALAARGAGGFVCFASGFDETGTEAGRERTSTSSIASHSGPTRSSAASPSAASRSCARAARFR